MAQDTLLGFPAHTLPYRRGEFTTLSTVSRPVHSYRAFLYLNVIIQIHSVRLRIRAISLA